MRALKKNLFFVALLASSGLLAIDISWLIDPLLPSLPLSSHGAFPSCVYVQIWRFYKDPHHFGLGRHLFSNRNSSYHLQWSYFQIRSQHEVLWSFPGSSAGKESACSVGDLDSMPGLRRFLGGGHDNPLQYSCLENPMDRAAWRAAVLGVTKSWMGLGN